MLILIVFVSIVAIIVVFSNFSYRKPFEECPKCPECQQCQECPKCPDTTNLENNLNACHLFAQKVILSYKGPLVSVDGRVLTISNSQLDYISKGHVTEYGKDTNQWFYDSITRTLQHSSSGLYINTESDAVTLSSDSKKASRLILKNNYFVDELSQKCLGFITGKLSLDSNCTNVMFLTEQLGMFSTDNLSWSHRNTLLFV